MLQILDKTLCSGCFACQAACPKKCIDLKQDDNGFYYPMIDRANCIDCRACEKTCPILNTVNTKDELRKNYGVINNDPSIRKASSSGGIFTLIATYVINNGGVVFGASMSEDCYSVEHIKIDKLEDLSKLRTSKYVQSKIGKCFTEVKEYLESGVTILFTGTPCQIGGLKAYLNKDYPNLITQDIVCHGTPSLAIWKSYVKQKEDEYQSKVISVNFRYKSPNKATYSLRMEFENDQVYCSDRHTDLYLRGFLSNLFLKPACYECRFKGVDREADITLADFWGVANYAPNLNKDFGVSLVTLHTQKGISIFNKIKNNTEFIEVDDKPLIENSCSVKSTLKPEGYDKFWNEYEMLGAKVLEKYFQLTLKEKTKRVVKRILGK